VRKLSATSNHIECNDCDLAPDVTLQMAKAHAESSGHTVVSVFERTTTYAGEPKVELVAYETAEQRFGKAVRTAREARGWTQERLRSELAPFGVLLEKTAMSRLEGGRRPTSLSEADAISRLLEIDAKAWAAS
jgi:ribosome-binding protein aMBF1 (putative translation factor)